MKDKDSVQLTVEEYDAIAEGYQEATKRELRLLVLEPTIRKHLGDLSGKKILDLACGEGYSSRLCRDLGAEKIVGVDVSPKEIDMARKLEVGVNKQSQIEYFVGDASKILLANKFDVITAIMLLHYSDTKEKMFQVIKNISLHLEKGGVFFTTIPNPEITTNYNNYGVKMEFHGKDEGSSFTITLSDFSGKVLCSFTNYHWTKQTYQRLLEENGFTVEWLDILVSPDGVVKYGENFWSDFKTLPVYAAIRATKI
ncbi:MAG: class I SAM-dependent methyltransferase [Candidatus Paceibacterota bacterium]